MILNTILAFTIYIHRDAVEKDNCLYFQEMLVNFK